MIDIAIDAAKQAGELALKYFKSQPKVEYKPDNTPVTRADREAEQLIRKIITQKFPDHGIIGEEFEAKNPSAHFKWVIDPIDGTRSFTLGLPLWSILIAVIENQKPIVAVAFSPAMNELITAEKDGGTYFNGKKTRVSKTRDLNKSLLIHGAIGYFKKTGKIDGLTNLSAQVGASRGYPDMGLNLIINGRADIYVNAKAAIHDLAAPSLLIEEAGGKLSDFSGKESITSGNVVATNGLLHTGVISLLNEK